MPRKKRTAKHRYEMTMDVINAGLFLHTWERFWGSRAKGRQAYEALRDEVNDGHPGCRSPMFWKYEPRVPVKLREVPYPPADPRLDGEEWEHAVTAERNDKLSRLKWLLKSEHLRPGESVVIRKEIDRLNSGGEP